MEISTRDITIIALCTAIISILAQFAIPLPFTPVPVTGQMMGVYLAGSMLGSKRGVLAITAYLLLGAVGAPVFAAARGGLQVLIGPSGGYLWGFIPGIFILGKKIENKACPPPAAILQGMIVCLLVSYLTGAIQLSFIMDLNLYQTLASGVLPYIPGDGIKIALALPLINSLKHQQRITPHMNN